ncbi:2-hydroxyacid dehydrogenase [Thalassobaculum salexigens]|uniref:2-hydroxyacid dehydrogenase n=1 Tax=Thalassobaculum salexigens TaxID=455360 RepID=UPI0004139560|nr:2-hydroxyacid dehydrogenase [Thalassobaculum salexigens]
MSEAPTVLLTGKNSIRRADFLAENTESDLRFVCCDMAEEPERLQELLPEADVIVGGGRGLKFPATNRLKLFQIPFTGYDWITPPELPKGVLFCNTHEHETTIAEHILAGMLEFQTGLMRDTHPMMVAKSYNGRSISAGPMHREMRGCTVGIVGYGHIGREVARRCKAFDMKVLAVSRTVRDEGDLVDAYWTVDDGLDRLCAESDFVIVCAPLDDVTRGMIGAAQFKAMKPDAVISNVGRGEVIDEAALYEALSSKRIRGGIIDVWYVYPSKDDPNPWPSKFPFQKLDNVILSPHNSAWTEPMTTRRWLFVAKQLDRFVTGEPLENVCFEGEG